MSQPGVPCDEEPTLEQDLADPGDDWSDTKATPQEELDQLREDYREVD